MKTVHDEVKVEYINMMPKLALLAVLMLMNSACHSQDMDTAAIHRDMEGRINAFKIELDQRPLFILDAYGTLNATDELPTKKVVMINDRQEEIMLDIPESVTLVESSALKSEQFGRLLIGTLQAHSTVYDIVHDDYNYGFTPTEIWVTADTDTFSYDALLEREPGMKDLTHGDLSVWISTDAASFSMDDYLVANPNLKIVKREGDRIVGYDIQYDRENETAFVHALFTLTYNKVGQSHIFIYGKVARSEVKNFPNREVMNRFINIFHLISEHVSIYPQG